MRFRLLILSALFTVLMPLCAFACGEGVQKLIKVDGWQVPDTAEMKQIHFKNLPVNTPPYAKAYAPKQKTYREFLIVSKQSGDPPGVLRYTARSYEIEAVVRYQAKQRAFAYQIFFKPDAPLGCTLAAVLSDEDGDGIFETYQAFFDSMPSVPGWAARIQGER